MEIPQYAPGCFGSAIAFKEDDAVCMGCPFSEKCRPLHESNRTLLRQRLGITAPEIGCEKAPVTNRNQDRLTVPKKVQELLDRIDRGDFNVVQSLRRGVNPFGGKMQFMRLACHLLLRFRGPVNQELLTAAFKSKLAWQDGTADAHARMAIQALTHIGAVRNIDGNITVRRD